VEHDVRLRRRGERETENAQGLVSAPEWRQSGARFGLGGAQVVLLVCLLVFGLGPILWLAKSAITPTADTLSSPMSLFPNGTAWDNLSRAWSEVEVGRYFWNTVVLAFGSWLTQIVVAVTGGFVLGVLKPRYAPLVKVMLLVTLFVPAVVLLVPLYIEIVNPPLIDASLIDSYWAVWLPAGASALNVILVTRFFENLPREVFEAARIDGAGPLQLLVRIALPMSKPIVAVVSVFAVLASWKDFLWPLLVLTNPDKQPLSVRLPAIQSQTELGVFLAAMLIACLVPIIGFLIFQRPFLRGTGLGGAVKG
jgi:multiple sugar transport system permease protein